MNIATDVWFRKYKDMYNCYEGVCYDIHILGPKGFHWSAIEGGSLSVDD